MLIPIRSAAIGLAAGAWLLQNQATLLSWPVLLVLMAIAILAGVAACRLRHSSARVSFALASGTLLGFVWAAGFAHFYLAQELPKEWEGRDITVVGTIDSLPNQFGRGVRFDFRVEQASADGQVLSVVPSRIALSWYYGFGDRRSTAVAPLRPGERWRLNVRLKRPHGNANPYGFDYEVWLLEQNLRATGYVRPDGKAVTKNERVTGFVFGVRNVIQRCREWVRERVLTALPDKPYAGVIVALVVGDQRAIEQSDWEVFNRTGVGHLIAISGLHITMVAGLFAGVMFQLWRRSFFTRAALPLVLPAQKAAALAGAVAALLYVALAGFGVPAQRTLYMVTVVAVALWCGRMTSVSHVLCMALGVVVLFDPWAVLGPGFWLSFGAVAIILYTSAGRARDNSADALPQMRRWQRTLHTAARTQYAVTLGLVPLTMLLFAQISIVGPIANAVAIPLVSLAITPLALVGAIIPASVSVWLLEFAHFLVEWLAVFLHWLSSMPIAVWNAPLPLPWIFGCAMVGTLWLLAPRGWPMRWLGLAGWLPLLLDAPSHPGKDEMWVTAFDVGQGMALLVETRQHRLLYDTGPGYSTESDSGNRVIVPYLKTRGIHALDGVIVSHGDNDHSGGAQSILKAVKVGWVASSLPEAHPIAQVAPNHRHCIAGQTWNWDGVQFDMMHPTASSYRSTKWKANARSCVLKVTLGERSILLAGDIEAVQEAELVNGMPDKLQASVLLAPHHGSGTSSTVPFLSAVKPELALFQVGYRNRYRHPKIDVYERYGAMGIKRLRSDESGAVTLRFSTALNASEYRVEHARYWYGR